jgi:hypothetical protein
VNTVIGSSAWCVGSLILRLSSLAAGIQVDRDRLDGREAFGAQVQRGAAGQRGHVGALRGGGFCIVVSMREGLSSR